MSEELPGFDPDRECPKCKHQEVSVQHIPYVFKRTSTERDEALVEEEHMIRKCMRCAYRWAEEPLKDDTG